jgi:hypothetical protein
MFGSASDLGRTGTSLYARGWMEVVARSSDQWRGVRICPLIPLILSECPGSIVRELGELSTWFEKVCDSDPQGLRESWASLVRAMETCSTGTAATDSMESYKVVLPGDLTTRALDHVVTFCSNSTLRGYPRTSTVSCSAHSSTWSLTISEPACAPRNTSQGQML